MQIKFDEIIKQIKLLVSRFFGRIQNIDVITPLARLHTFLKNFINKTAQTINSLIHKIVRVVRNVISITAWSIKTFIYKTVRAITNVICKAAQLIWRWLNLIRHSRLYRHIKDRLTQYSLLCRLNKPIGIYLLLWPTLMALWIAAEGVPDKLILLVFVLGTVLMRSAGCAINDFADRNFDHSVSRTQNRPIVLGKVSAKEALGVFFVLVLAAFCLVLQLNQLTLLLSVVAVLLAGFYPFAKRFTYMPQMVLGAAFAWAIPMAFAAQSNEIPVIAWLLFTATLLWATAYDTMYAMVDREDDIKIGVKSTAILFGEADIIITMFLQGLVLLAFFLLGRQLQLSAWYYIGFIVAVIVSLHQYHLIKDRQPEKCLLAFLESHYVGLVLFGGLAMHYASTSVNAA